MSSNDLSKEELQIDMPSDTDTAVLGDEKQETQAPNRDDFLVQWDGDNDPLSPRSLPQLRKWLFVVIISTGITLVTCSSSIYSLTYEQLEKEFNVSQEVATLGLTLFVVGLGIGPMFVSPLSEFYGRKPIYVVSIFFYIIFLIPSAAAQNIQTMLVGRFLDGLAGSAFLTVAAGTVYDLFIPAQIQAPMMLFTVTPFLGPVLGPVVGGFINQFSTWRWSFYILIIWSVLTFIGVLFVPETYHPVLLHHKAASLRTSTGNPLYHSASEDLRASRTLSSSLFISLKTPFQLLFLEPMCTALCLYSALLLGILYLFFGAFPLVFQTNHNFNLWQIGLSFTGLGVGMVAALFTNPFWAKNYHRLVTKAREDESEEGEVQGSRKPDPEFRLPPAILGGVLVPVGLFWFGWTTYASVHWVVPIVGSGIFGAGMFLVFSGVFTFLVDAYPLYAASAMAANTFTRTMFAGAFPLFGDQMYEKLGYQWATSLLAFLALAMMPFPYMFFKYGKLLRAKSRFASL